MTIATGESGAANGDIIFKIAAVEKARISSAGKVGISTGIPTTTLDVNGDAQFGSGTTKSTFTSTGLLKLTSNGIQWADGSTSTAAASGVAAAISTESFIPSQNFTNTSNGPCFTGSTVTFTLAATQTCNIGFVGQVYNNSAGAGTAMYFQYLLNGALSGALTVVSIAATNYTFNPSFVDLTGAKTAGTYSVCITGAVGAGTGVTSSNNRVWVKCN